MCRCPHPRDGRRKIPRGPSSANGAPSGGKRYSPGWIGTRPCTRKAGAASQPPCDPLFVTPRLTDSPQCRLSGAACPTARGFSSALKRPTRGSSHWWGGFGRNRVGCGEVGGGGGGGRMGRAGKELDKGPEAGRGGRVSRRGGGVPRAWVSGGSPEADGSRNSCSDNVFGGPFRKREPVFFPKRLRRHRFNKRKTSRFSTELDPENGIDGPTDGNQVSLSLKRPRTLLF